MVRNYLSTVSNTRNGKNYTPYQSYSPQTIENALLDVRNGMPVLEAVRVYKIPKTTLYRAINGENTHHRAGHPQLFSPTIENKFIDYINLVGDWGFPMDLLDLRCLAKFYLDDRKLIVPQIRDNMPGIEWARAFLNRHKVSVSNRLASNISRKRAAVTETMLRSFFTNAEADLISIAPENLINYDETNLTDNPGASTFIFKRGSKYPERIVNSNPKSSISIMYSGTASGHVFPPYVVYKSSQMWTCWTEGGPSGARYNRSTSGWFDSVCFADWFETIILPYCRHLEGPKILLGDNLSSHFNAKVLRLCQENDIQFKCLPPNCTHLMQPLDVAFFAPLKKYWRQVLQEWKKKDGRYTPALTKEFFPRLLKKLHDKLEMGSRGSHNIKAGFEACGLFPFNPDRPCKRLPHASTVHDTAETAAHIISQGVMNMLEEMRSSGTSTPVRRTKITLAPGCSIGATDLEKLHVKDRLVKRRKVRSASGSHISAEDLLEEEAEDDPGYDATINTDVNQEEDSAAVVSDPQAVPIKRKRGRPAKSKDQIDSHLNPLPDNSHNIEPEAGPSSAVTGPKMGPPESLRIKDWVLVKFDVEKSNKKRCYIGQLEKMKIQHDKYYASFLRAIPTKKEAGFVYSKPKIEDISQFKFDQIVQILPPPTTYLRDGMFLFNIHVDSLTC